ncbi:MAG: site-2 protease family protein [Candidatus Eisenbacteria sp.]|nr:site-2 protease family protein [Candidatus Eisenbacteria bacterium]
MNDPSGIPPGQRPFTGGGEGVPGAGHGGDTTGPPGSGTRPRWRLHVGLFAGTIASTFFVGYLMSADIWQAAGYSASIMGILLVHEMGHFVMCLRDRVPATLPYFIPVPLPPFGTMGAVIRMRGLLQSRRSIFDIGAAGPLAGLALAIPVTYVGLKLSQIVLPGDASLEGTIRLGDSILFWLLTRAALGPIGPEADVLLHPVALAGWAGLFVTGLNLLPIGQLDGGHILYALLGRRARWVGMVFLGVMIVLTIFYRRGWWLMTMLLLIFMRREHPPVADMRPLDRRRVLLGILMMIIFLVTFVPGLMW